MDKGREEGEKDARMWDVGWFDGCWKGGGMVGCVGIIYFYIDDTIDVLFTNHAVLSIKCANNQDPSISRFSPDLPLMQRSKTPL